MPRDIKGLLWLKRDNLINVVQLTVQKSYTKLKCCMIACQNYVLRSDAFKWTESKSKMIRSCKKVYNFHMEEVDPFHGTFQKSLIRIK